MPDLFKFVWLMRAEHYSVKLSVTDSQDHRVDFQMSGKHTTNFDRHKKRFYQIASEVHQSIFGLGANDVTLCPCPLLLFFLTLPWPLCCSLPHPVLLLSICSHRVFLCMFVLATWAFERVGLYVWTPSVVSFHCLQLAKPEVFPSL